MHVWASVTVLVCLSFGLCALNKHEEGVCVCVLVLWGGVEHQCAVLAGLAVQHVEQARTRFRRGREDDYPNQPSPCTHKNTHNKKHSSRLLRLVQHTHIFSLFPFSPARDKLPKVRTRMSYSSGCCVRLGLCVFMCAVCVCARV